MNTILLINGPSSSGKTTLAKTFTDIVNEPWLIMGIDFCMDMLSQRYIGNNLTAKNGFYYIQHYSNHHITTESTVGPIGDAVLKLIPVMAKIIADAGFNIIIDEVILSDDRFLTYLNYFYSYNSYAIGITCNIDILESREAIRGNRRPGLARGQLDLIHTGIRAYDIMLDTGNQSSFLCAEIIKNHLQKYPPKALKALASSLII